MGKGQGSRKRAATDDYDSDGGFVEDAPKSKKNKGSAPKASVNYDMQKDSDGNEYWEISGKRRLQVSSFKGNTMIGIREYYEKDGQMLPGKKGVSLNLDQFNAFVELLPQVETVLKSRLKSEDVEISRPDYDRKTFPKAANPDQGALEDGSSDDEKKSVGKRGKSKSKKNHEVTSDEDED